MYIGNLVIIYTSRRGSDRAPGGQEPSREHVESLMAVHRDHVEAPQRALPVQLGTVDGHHLGETALKQLESADLEARFDLFGMKTRWSLHLVFHVFMLPHLFTFPTCWRHLRNSSILLSSTSYCLVSSTSFRSATATTPTATAPPRSPESSRDVAGQMVSRSLHMRRSALSTDSAAGTERLCNTAVRRSKVFASCPKRF